MKNPILSLMPAPAALHGPLRTEEDIAVHRRIYCSKYERCLDESTRQGWQSFTCTRCPLKDFAPTRPGSKPFAEQRRPIE